jgi:aspartate 1-decarboxylase
MGVEDFLVQRFMLKSKIHRATLTGTDLDYEGSIAIDRDLLQAADILPGEQVHVLNLNNGERLITYAIEAPAGTGTVLLNGPAARLGLVGDLVVVITYCSVAETEARSLRPTVVLVDAKNRIK